MDLIYLFYLRFGYYNKLPQLSGLNNKHLFLTVVEARCWRWEPVSWSADGLYCCVLTWQRAKSASSDVSVIRTLIPGMRALTSKPNYLPNVPPPNKITLGVKILASESEEEDKHSVHNSAICHSCGPEKSRLCTKQAYSNHILICLC